MPKHIWVNIYSVTEHWGGAEEGGWTYDVGIPEWSRQGICHCEALDAQAWADTGAHLSHCPIFHYLAQAGHWVSGYRAGYLKSFTSGDPEEPEYRGEAIHERKEVREEDHTGLAYPEYPPHYE